MTTRNRTTRVLSRGRAAERRGSAPIASSRNPEARRVVVHPVLGPPEGLDVTDSLVGAIARELSRAHGGNDVLNRLEAEQLLAAAFEEVQCA